MPAAISPRSSRPTACAGLRETTAMGTLLAVHLGFVAALFLTLPYGKMVHGVYRLLARIQNAAEQRAQG